MNPPARAAPGPLAVICGLPGSGKSTLARALAPRLRATCLSSDLVRRELGLLSRYDAASSARVYHELLKGAKLALPYGAVVVDATFADRRFRDAAVYAAAEVGCRWVVILVQAEEAIALSRVARRRGESEAGATAYRQLRNAFDPVSLPHLALDTSRRTIEQLVDEAEVYVLGPRARSTAPAG